MRLWPTAALAAYMILFGAAPAAASCAPPATLADNAARAVAVVYGTVTSAGGGAITVRVDRVLKGDVRTPLRVFVGPARGGGAAPVVTSVDYVAPVGSDHVLYLVYTTDSQLVRATGGDLETNACIGSHPGPPDDKETAFFGPGTAPLPASDGIPTWMAAGVALAALALTGFLLWKGASARRKSAGAD